MRIDAQVHIWGADTPARPWPAVHGEPHRDPPFSAEEIVAAMDRANVDAAVIVPPSWEGDRNDLALAAVRAHPDRFGVMGRLDVSTPPDLSRWRDAPGMLGVRLTFHRPEMRSWLTDGTCDRLFADAEEAAVPVMVFAPGQTPALVEVARRHPGLVLIVDHLNLATDATAADIAPCIDALRPLVAFENAAVKISALPCHTQERFPFPDLARAIRRVVDDFGPDRCAFGSDISRLPCPYGEWVAMFDAATGVLDAAESEAVGGETIRRLLRFDEAATRTGGT